MAYSTYQPGGPGAPQRQWQNPKPAAAWQYRGGAPSSGAPAPPNPLIQHQQAAWQAMASPTPLQQPVSTPPPQLPQPTSLAELTQTLTPFPMMQYGTTGFPTFRPGGAPAGAGPAQITAPAGPSQANVSGGITPPMMPAPPNLQVPASQGGNLAGLLANYLAPAQASAMGEWSTNAAQLGNQSQQAQAQSGLAWGGLANQMANAQNSLNLQRYQNLLGMLGAISGGLGR